jgi:serine protease AprX
MNRINLRRIGNIVLLVMALVFALTQTCIIAAATDQTVIGKKKICQFTGGQLGELKYSDKTLEAVIRSDSEVTEKYDLDESSVQNKISDRLLAELDKSNDKAVTVSIWITDADYEPINKAVGAEMNIYNLKSASPEMFAQYLNTKRQKKKAKSIEKNEAFLNRYQISAAMLYKSVYAPLIIAELDRQMITRMAQDEEVLMMDLFVNAKKVDETTYSISNINAKYTRNLGYTGRGVKVGIVECGYPDTTNTQLSDRDINFDVAAGVARRRLSSHATAVASIVVGNTEGIAPAATLYAVQALTRLQDYQKIEWLLDRGVAVINYSAGYRDVQGTYSDMAKWIDYLGNQHNVHFVKSAGNYSSSYLITDPGMAYNALTVGSINDNDSSREPDWTDDTLSTFSCYAENSGGYKPDLTAPGQGINIAGYTNKNGTSFAAAHVTAVLAQLLAYDRRLLVNTALLKAICAAGTTHRTADDYGVYSLSAVYSDREGAGVIDAKGAYTIAANATYAALELNSSQFPYYINFTIARVTNPVRVALAWLKQHTFTMTSRAGVTVTQRPLSDLDLTVYNPSGVAVRSSVSDLNNLELVQFEPRVTGTYRIKISGYALKNISEKIGVAWYQAP